MVRGKGKINMDDGVHLRSREFGYHSGMPFRSTLFADGDEAIIKIGENTRLNGCYVHSKCEITIGQNCAIASGVNILDSNGHKTLSTNRILERDNPHAIRIGNNVWIGLNVVVLKGSKIGDNSIIGANSVVKGDFPNNSLIIGNPAKMVKTLEF